MRHALWPSRPFCEGYKNLARTSPNPPPLTPLVTCAFVFAVVRFLFSIAGKAVLRPLTPHDVRFSGTTCVFVFASSRSSCRLVDDVRFFVAGLLTTCAFVFASSRSSCRLGDDVRFLYLQVRGVLAAYLRRIHVAGGQKVHCSLGDETSGLTKAV